MHVQFRVEEYHHTGWIVNKRRNLPRLSPLLAPRRPLPLLQSTLARHYIALARHPGIAPVRNFNLLFFLLLGPAQTAQYIAPHSKRIFFYLMRFFFVVNSGSDPVRIKSPPELADQTVEERLITFDWDKNFHTFQEATRRGAYRPLCWGKTQALIDGIYYSSLNSRNGEFDVYFLLS